MKSTDKQTVIRVTPPAYNALQRIKDKHPQIRHTAIIEEAMKEDSGLTAFDNIKGITAGAMAIRIKASQIASLKEQAQEINISMMQLLSQQITNLAKRLGV